MEVILAKTAGFCFGVQRAVDKVYEAASSGKKIYTLGPIIHNNEVVRDLESQGVVTLKDESELDKVEEGGVVVIRSHGVPKRVCDELERRNIEYIDVTCPFVKRIHGIVEKESVNGDIIITGSKVHPEVQGIMGWSHRPTVVIETMEDADAYTMPENGSVTMVSQTTFNHIKFKEFVELFNKKSYNVNIVDTICDATRKRQLEAEEVAAAVDTMIVIGDKQSSNSRKLYDICKSKCDNTYFIQTLSELHFDEGTVLGDKLGITAGASTPNNIIKEVQNYVRINF